MAHSGLSSSEVIERRKEYGWNEVLEKKTNTLLIFIKKFWGPSAWMIELIAVVSIVLHRSADFTIAMGLLIANALISFLEEHRTESTVKILKQRLKILTRVLRDNKWQQISSRELVPGDIVKVGLGDIVPGDIKVEEGEVLVDQSILTGESGDIEKSIGDTIYSGSLIRRGESTCKVIATGAKTYFGKTIELVQSASPRSHMEEIVIKLVHYLFVIVGILVALIAIVSLYRGSPFTEVLPLSLILLMSGVPIALPVMFTVSTAIAAQRLGRKGVLVTRLSATEDAATMSMLFVDKTGTITENKLIVAEVNPLESGKEQELLTCAALASDTASRDSIDKAIFDYCSAHHILPQAKGEIRFTPFSPETRRTESIIKESGHEIVLTKGAVWEILSWVAEKHSHEQNILAEVEHAASKGYRTIGVARSFTDGTRRFLGLISFQDPPRKDSFDLINALRRLGLQIKMLTGDSQPVAQEIASMVGLGKVITWPQKKTDIDWQNIDGLAQVFPETKFQVIESAQAQNHIVGMTGDGVNDAPALKRAEVGIAVFTASDAAKSAASVVLTNEGLSQIVALVENGRAVYQRILTWVINKISRTVLKAGFVVSSYFLYGRFIISSLAMILLVFLSDFAKISLSTDNVRTSSKPDTWKIRPLVLLGVILGVLMIAESHLNLWIAIHYLDINAKQIDTYSFLTLLFMAAFSVFSIRERKRFWSTWPSNWVLITHGANIMVGIAIGIFGFFDLPPISITCISVTFLLSAGLILTINDAVKFIFLNR